MNFPYYILGLSFLNPNSFFPWPNFQQDSLAIASLFFLIILNINQIKKVTIPKFLIFFTCLLIGIVFFQYFLSYYYFRQDYIIFLLYSSIFIIAFIFSHNIDLNINKIFYVIIIVSIINVFIQILQWFNFDSNFFANSYYNRPSGNIGQPNQLSTLLFMGLYSLSYIRNKIELNYLIYICITFFIIFGIALTDSRTAWIVLFCSIIIIILRDKSKLKDFLLKILFYIVSLFSINLINKAYNLNGSSEIRNLESLRFYNWNQLFAAIIERPYFGYGANQTALAQSIISEKIKSAEYLTYAHNILIDLFLWFGIPIGLAIFIVFCFLFFKKYYCNSELDTYILLLLLAFIIHCNLEYPFAYAYFLIPIGVIMGFYYKGESYKINKMYFGAFLCVVYLILMVLFFEYLFLKKTINDLSFEDSLDANSQVYTYRIIDALSFSEIYKFKDYCSGTLKYKEKEHFENIYYRYPSGRNIYLHTYRSIDAHAINYKVKKYLSYQVKDVDKAINIMSQKVADCD